jgi:tripartite-type tricarboxylate transporter receptor subunit TctC
MRRLAPLAALAALVSIQQPAQSQEGEPFFKGKTIRFVLGAAPGQEYDLWTRLMTRHLPRYIEGNPNFVVENMTGAGFIVATNWLYNRGTRDGTVWGMANHNVADQALSKIPNVSYDPAKFNWIGTPEVTNRGCFALSSAPAKSAQDLFKTQMVMGGTAAGSPVTQTPRLMKNLLGMKFKVVTGYARPQDAILSMERGEVEGVCQTIQSFNLFRPGWIQSGHARVLFTTEEERVPGVDAPSIMEFAKTDEQRAILRYYNSGAELGRPIMLPPDVPKDRVQMLRRAFDRTMQDPEFLKEAAKSKYVITPRTGEKLAEIIERQMSTSPAIIEKTAELTLKP